MTKNWFKHLYSQTASYMCETCKVGEQRTPNSVCCECWMFPDYFCETCNMPVPQLNLPYNFACGLIAFLSVKKTHHFFVLTDITNYDRWTILRRYIPEQSFDVASTAVSKVMYSMKGTRKARFSEMWRNYLYVVFKSYIMKTIINVMRRFLFAWVPTSTGLELI